MRFSFNDLKLPDAVLAAWQRLLASRIGQRVAALPWWHRWPTRREWLLFAAALPLLFALYVLALIPFTPGIRDIRKAKLEQPAQIMSADGKQLAQFKRSNRQWVKLDEMSPSVIKALIATEDHRFYEHHGMDWRRTLGSVVHTLRGDPQGGSTLTQQLARNLYPTEIGRAPTLNRKLKEAITAFKIEALYTKDEILETYLNTVPFLYNAFGIEMAARTYFDKPAARLTVLESATLVGMLKGTSYYNPVLNPDRALYRRNTVLSQMVKRGVLQEAEFAQLKKRPMRINFERQEEPLGMAPHFAQHLRKWLIDWADRNDYNIYTDGLVVYTTIDSRLQNWANQAVARQTRTLQGVANGAWSQRDGWNAANPLVQQLVRETPAWRAARKRADSQGKDKATDKATDKDSEEDTLKALLADKAFMKQLREDKTRVQAGFVALNPATSEVLAWVGSRDFTQDAYDHVQQARRQPGSTFKPFVYGAALQQGATPTTSAWTAPWKSSWPAAKSGAPPTPRPHGPRDDAARRPGLLQEHHHRRSHAVRGPRPRGTPGPRPGRAPEPAGRGSRPGPGQQPGVTAGDGQRLCQPGTRWPLAATHDGHAHRGRRRQGHRRIQPAQARARAGRRPRLRPGGHAARRGGQRHGRGRAPALRHPRRRGRQDRHHPGQCRWLVHPHAPGNRHRRLGRLQRRAHHPAQRPLGPGSRSALPMVGDFMSRALRSPVIDAKARFEPPEQSHWWSDMVGRLRERMQGWWPDQQPPAQPGQPATPEPAPAPEPAPEPTEPPGPGLSPGEEIIESTPALPAPSIPLTQGTLGPTDQRAVQEATPTTPALPGGEDAPAGTGVVITPIQP